MEINVKQMRFKHKSSILEYYDTNKTFVNIFNDLQEEIYKSLWDRSKLTQRSFYYQNENLYLLMFLILSFEELGYNVEQNNFLNNSIKITW